MLNLSRYSILKNLLTVFTILIVLQGYSSSVCAQTHGGQQNVSVATINTLSDENTTQALKLSTLTGIAGLVEQIPDSRVVFIGETHDRYDHHLNQLEIIRQLHAQDSAIAIGIEYIQRSFQSHLDDYIAGKINQQSMLRQTEYYQRWRYDFRLYQPIFSFAREHRIPLIALNVSSELTRQVSEKGVAGLDPKYRALIPESIDRDMVSYRARIEQVFAMHPDSEDKAFENFFEAQLLWDEGMADRAAGYLKDNPRQRMVILAGSGHLVYGQGIPARLTRRLPLTSTIIINSDNDQIEPDMADYALLGKALKLPRNGLLGVMLEGEQGVTIKGFADDSPAEKTGLIEGDRIVSIAGQSVEAYSDIRINMSGLLPDTEVEVQIERDSEDGNTGRKVFIIMLY